MKLRFITMGLHTGAKHTGMMTSSIFFVYRYPALNVNDDFCLRIIEDDGSFNDEDVFEMDHPDIDFIKKIFLAAKIFDGKSFWEVEPEIA